MWPAGDKSPAGRNPRRPNAGLRFGKRSASETGFFLARYRAENRCRLIGRHTCTASMRRSHVQHNTARVPRRTPFWPKPQKGAKALFPVHPAASINEPPAPHRMRQVAAKGGMLQTRSRPQSCGFRPPVLATTAKRDAPYSAPDAAEPVEQNSFLLMQPGCANQLFSADISGGALPASAGLSSVDRA